MSGISTWARDDESGMSYAWTTRWNWRLLAASLPLSIAATNIALGLLILAAVLRFRGVPAPMGGTA